ncbi:hypothetical protein [Paenibacillus timonensis]|nr:hypothetical protein [Paenibacillus timonensis]
MPGWKPRDDGSRGFFAAAACEAPQLQARTAKETLRRIVGRKNINHMN